MSLRLASRLILVVDDEPGILEIVSSALLFEGYRVETAASGEEALEKLSKFTPDLVLLDITMPGFSGYETLAELRKQESYVSVIFVSALAGSDDVARGLDAGADDYLCKPFDPGVLLAKVRAQLRIKDIRDNLKIANQRLQDLVEIDDLTGLFNMRSIYQKIETELGRARRYGRAVGVVMMDMDNFKTVNDTNDHLFGSHVLSEVGKIIQKTIRQADFAARYGGDEFLIALAETTPDGAVAFAERLRSAIAAATFTSPHSNPPATMRLTASLGVAVYHAGSEPIDARSLVLNADHALYEAKHAGKDCIRVFDLKATDILAKRTS